jgi:hypothetical protein
MLAGAATPRTQAPLPSHGARRATRRAGSVQRGDGRVYPIISGFGMISKRMSECRSVNLGARPKSLRSFW